MTTDGACMLRVEGHHAAQVLDVARFESVADSVDRRLLARARGPVLDVGCGPGRLLAELGERGVPALGIEPATSAAALARGRGGAVLERSVFDRLPGTGRWGTALLVDGNIGIGGDPATLLQRLVTLLHAQGQALVELDVSVTGIDVVTARLERDGLVSAWFPWAMVGIDAIAEVAAAAGLVTAERWADGGRCFVRLARPARLERLEPVERLERVEP